MKQTVLLAILSAFFAVVTLTPPSSAGEVHDSVATLAASGAKDGKPGILVRLLWRIGDARSLIEGAGRSRDLDNARRLLEESAAVLEDGPDGAAALIEGALRELGGLEKSGLDEGGALAVDRIRTALGNTDTWAKEAVKHAGYGIKAPTTEGATLHAGHVGKWLTRMERGFDSNRNGRIEWNEGGAAVALELSRRLAD